MFDLVVVGGGPAGLAAALAAAARGLRAAVVDPSHHPIDKACGEGLMPDSRAPLRALGVAPPSGAGLAFPGMRVAGAAAAGHAVFPQGPGLGLRRTALHALLAGRAARAGVELIWGARVTGLSSRGVWVGSHEIPCRFVIGADGQSSRVRRWAALDRFTGEQRRYGFRRHYAIAPWSDFMEVHWGPGAQIYVTPVSATEICVALIGRDPKLRLDRALPMFPALAARLAGAPHDTPERGALSISRRVVRVANQRVALIGDASGSVDAITGDGLYLAFEQAQALASALAQGRLDSYAAAHRRLMRRPALVSSFLLSLDRFPALRRRVLPALAARPALFEAMLGLHVGAVSPAAFARRALLPPGWRMRAAQ